MNIILILAGMIGSGKTTYTKKLAEELGTKPFYEPVKDNPKLDKFYNDPIEHAYPLQIDFLSKRFSSIKRAFNEDNNVLDRSIYEDELFTYVNVLQGNIAQDDFEIYQNLLANMMEELDSLPKKAPDLLIYLDTDLEHVLQNIEKRGREFEQIDDTKDGRELEAYYKLLLEHYPGWYERYDKSPKVKIDVRGLDIHKPEDWEVAFGIIKEKMKEIGIYG